MHHGIGRGGTPGGNSSGDMFLAFSTANDLDLPQVSGPWRQMTCLNDELLDPVYLAAVEAVEEAVLNAMLAAEDTPMARPRSEERRVGKESRARESPKTINEDKTKD